MAATLETFAGGSFVLHLECCRRHRNLKNLPVQIRADSDVQTKHGPIWPEDLPGEDLCRESLLCVSRLLRQESKSGSQMII